MVISYIAEIDREYEKRLDELTKAGKDTEELALWYQEQLQKHHDNKECKNLVCLSFFLIPKSFPKFIDF